MDKKEKIFDMGKCISDEMENIEIPESLNPENMRKKLEKTPVKKIRYRKWVGSLATAACLLVVVGASIYANKINPTNEYKQKEQKEVVNETPASDIKPTESDIYVANKDLYDEIYSLVVENNPSFCYEYLDTEGSIVDRVFFSGAESKGEAIMEDAVAENTTASSVTTTGRGDYAQTNVQVQSVDEGDIAKNDGRYLYQIISDENDSIQIIDTLNGLKEVACIDDFSDSIGEFYVYEDTLVVIEGIDVYEDDHKAMEDIIYTDCVINYCYGHSCISRISFYDISDRTNPVKINDFTINGRYKTSRISDGFLYFISDYNTKEAESEEDISAYIPVVEGEYFTNDSICIPEESEAYNYLMVLSVDIENPVEFTDKMAVVSSGWNYYVSTENIYVLDSNDGEMETGIVSDETRIVKFSYDKGNIEYATENVVKGSILDQFAMDETDGYFRMVTTVNSYEVEDVTDDISGNNMGYTVTRWLDDTNNVYVLDENLNVVGSIEGLAEDERVYSARFMGNIGYFVTFKQMDPLFSVDFSDPANPKILGELKISGFSDYLHFYGENLLLGIGYEADEETGRTECIKLSMFDISNPADVKETHKLLLEEYDHSNALDNHNAVLVSVGKNLIGFECIGYGEDYLKEYNLFSYDAANGFYRKFAIDCDNNNYWCEPRGTYIEDTFYLLKQSYGVESYDLNSGEKLEELKRTK